MRLPRQATGISGYKPFAPLPHLEADVPLTWSSATSVAGTIAHTRLGNVRWRWAIGIALFSVPTGLLFGTLAGGWIDQQVLRYIFVALLIYFSLRMFGTIPWLRRRVGRSG